jgi:alpha,alpha-trehalase
VDRRTRPAAPRPGSLADEIADRWIRHNVAVFRETGKLVEQYDVTEAAGAAGGSEYPLQDGLGWTNGVRRRLLALYAQALAEPPPR